MRKIEEAIYGRKQFLERLITEKEKDIERLPQGNVRVVRHGRGYQYYLREDKKDKNGKYVSKKEIKKVCKMIQREYGEKVLKRAKEEWSLLRRIEGLYKSGIAEDIYDRMPSGKQAVVTSIVETDQEYLQKWMNQSYEKKSFREDAPEYYSNKGERMRSKSEVIIANLLDKLEIPYLYEMPLELNKWLTVHPDFTIIDVANRRVILWEHLGMLGDVEYLNQSIQKIREYELCGYYPGDSLIITGESDRHPLDIRLVEKRIRHVMGMLNQIT